MAILSGYKPNEIKENVESVKLETGTRHGTLKITVNGKTTDNILVKGAKNKPEGTSVDKLDDRYALKDHKHRQYLKPDDVNIKGTGSNGEIELHEEDTDGSNGTITLEMKKGSSYERVIDLPFTGLRHLAFVDQLTRYNDVTDPQDPTVITEQAEVSASFKSDMKSDLNDTLDFVSTVRNSTIEGGVLTIDNRDADAPHDAMYIYGNDLYLSRSDAIPDPDNPGSTYKKGGNLDCYSIDATAIKGTSLTIGSSSSNTDIDYNGNISTDGNINVQGDVGVVGEIYKASSPLKLQYSVAEDLSLCNGGGTVKCGSNIEATSFDTSSDERLKVIRGDVKLTLEQIASAPSVLFNWKNDENGKLNAGTVAQYWKEIAPWAVNEDSEGMLTVNYPALALAASIQCAREISELKERIDKLG